jgi:hypothetical protein
MKRLMIIEERIEPKDVSVEDGGCAKIACVSGDPEQDEGLYIKLVSWSEKHNHPDFPRHHRDPGLMGMSLSLHS